MLNESLSGAAEPCRMVFL